MSGNVDNGLDNGGLGPLKVAGFNDHPIFLELKDEDRFTHGANDWEQWPNLTVRELAMLGVIDAITDKPDWHSKVFNDQIVARWREEALEKPLISTKAWDWCLSELQDKAVYFEKTGRILVFNTGCGICKSDTLVTAKLKADLREGVAPLLAQPDTEKDWHPNSSEQVLNLVHPSLFPLVYGRTRVLVDGGQVSLDDCVSSCGQGNVAPTPPYDNVSQYVLRHANENLGMPHWKCTESYAYHWSIKYQWLPCEVEFKEGAGTNVHITSYINNLHPTYHKPLYHTIEKLISQAIGPWNDILVKGRRGRTPMRIRTWGVEWLPEYPDWAANNSLLNLEGDRTSEAYKEAVLKIKDYLELPEPMESKSYWDIPDNWEDSTEGLAEAVKVKWERLCNWVHPEPGTAFSYHDWKKGRTGKAIINRTSREYPEKQIAPDPDHEYYSIALQDTFRTKGLQVVVKIASIELSPEKPSYAGGSWHIEGMWNDHIAATAIYYYDSDNVTDARLSFRQEAKMDYDEFVYERYRYSPITEVFGVPHGDDMIGIYEGTGFPAIQELGSVCTKEGRMLAWPNTLQHRVEPFNLVDGTRAGHRRFIVLWLVDPHYRVCSTRNVPPQRHDWWIEEALANTGLPSYKVPQEVMDLIDEGTDQWPMGLDEAKQLRLDLMKERTVAENEAMESGTHTYNFCEH